MEDSVFRYAPMIYMDKKEPVKVKKVSVTIYDEDGARSISFNRAFDFGNYKGTVKVLEYAYYLDYDIQHLYDLEHIWVYIDEVGEVTGVEGSYHGRFLSCINRAERADKGFAEFDGDRVKMYSQPGKHAMLACPKLMYLYPELYESCGRLAGIHGLDAPGKFLTRIHISDEDNDKIVQYIREKYSFVPTMEFEEYVIPEDDYMSWDELEKTIPKYIMKQLDALNIRY